MANADCRAVQSSPGKTLALQDFGPGLRDDLREGMRKLYGERLKRLCIYGSYARGEAEPESDLDVLIVLDCIASYDEEIERTGQLISELSLKYQVTLSRVFLSLDAWTRPQSSFARRLQTEAIPA
jgi:predicted nucleotidyltransferase